MTGEADCCFEAEVEAATGTAVSFTSGSPAAAGTVLASAEVVAGGALSVVGGSDSAVAGLPPFSPPKYPQPPLMPPFSPMKCFQPPRMFPPFRPKGFPHPDTRPGSGGLGSMGWLGFPPPPPAAMFWKFCELGSGLGEGWPAEPGVTRPAEPGVSGPWLPGVLLPLGRRMGPPEGGAGAGLP